MNGGLWELVLNYLGGICLNKAGFKNVYFDPYTGQGPKPNGKPPNEHAWRFIGRPELFKELQS